MGEHYGPVTLHSAAVATAVGAVIDVRRHLTKIIEIVTATSFDGTADIQGSLDGTNFVNCRYAPLATTGALGYVVVQLAYTNDASRAFFIVTDYWPYIRVNMTRTDGNITVKLAAISEGSAA